MPVFSDASRFPSVYTQTEDTANPETGVPSPRFGTFGSHASTFSSTPAAGLGGLPASSTYGPMTTSSADVAANNLLRSYNPSAYAGNTYIILL
jgi:hypothetical protein